MDSNILAEVGLTPADFQSALPAQQTQTPGTDMTAPAAPVPGMPVEDEQPTASLDVSSEDPGLLGTLGDMAMGIARGAGDAYNEVHDFVAGEDEKDFRLDLDDNITGAGRVVRSLSQFAAGFVGAGKFLKAANVLQGASKAVTIGRAMAQGAITDAVAFDPHEERLSNLIDDIPELANPVTEYLKSKPGDTEAEGRFKNALEGLGLGIAMDGILAGVKGIYRMRHATTGAEKAAIQEELADIMQPLVKEDDGAIAEATAEMVVNTRGWNKTAAEAVTEGEMNVGEKGIAKDAPVDPSLKVDAPGEEAAGAKVTPEGDPGSGRRFIGHLTEDDVHKIIKDAKTPDDAWDRLDNSINFRKMSIYDEQTEQALHEFSKRLYDHTAKAKGPYALEAMQRDALDDLSKYGVNTDEHIAVLQKDTAAGNRLIPAMIQGRQMLKQMTEEAVTLSHAIDGGRASARDLAKFHAMYSEMQDLHLALADARTMSGRLLGSNRIANEDVAKLEIIYGSEKLPQDAATKVKPEATPAGKTKGEVKPEGAPAGKPSDPTVKPEGQPTEKPTRKARVKEVEAMTEEQALEYISKNGLSERKLKELASQVRMAEGDPFAAQRLLKKAFTGSWWGVHNEYTINSLLSGYWTQATNALSTGLKTFVLPTEKWIGGVMRGDKVAREEAVRTMSGLLKFQTDAFRLAWKAFKTNNSVLDAGSSVLADAPTKQMSYENIKNLFLSSNLNTTDMNAIKGGTLKPHQEIMARAFDYLGRFVNIPSRLLMTTDEFFKQLNFRAELYSRLHTEAAQRIGAKGDIAGYVEREMARYFDNGGRAIDFAGDLKTLKSAQANPHAIEVASRLADNANSAMRYSQQATWTQPLEYGIGRTLQRATAVHPSLKMVIPFIRTPTNLIRDFMAHTPIIAQRTRRYKEAMMQGGEAAAIAHGQLALGSMLWVTAAGLASTGMLTGAPPKDPKLRALQEAQGIKPWSIKIGDTYVSYRRGDPYGMFLGMAADINRIFEDLPDMKRDEVAMSAIVALANNLTSKTYLQGITEVISAMTDPDKNLLTLAKNRAATYVPQSALLRNVRQDFVDEHMREVRGVLDNLMNTIPGMSDELPAKRNWITGQPTDYSIYSDHKPDMMYEELARLGKRTLGAPPRTLSDGSRLTPEQYSRLCELHGTIKVQGRTLKESLETLFNSEKYDINRERLADPILEADNDPRSDTVDKIIKVYRKAATKTLMQENPELVMEVEKNRRMAKASKKGILTQANQDKFAGLLNY